VHIGRSVGGGGSGSGGVGEGGGSSCSVFGVEPKRRR